MKIRIAIFIVFALVNVNPTKCQNFYKGNPWIMGFGLNLIIEDAEQFRGYMQGERVKWNLSPFTFNAEKRINHGFGLSFNVGSNLFPERQLIDGVTLKRPVDIFFLESQLKYNLNYIVKEDNKFDPYINVTSGFWFKSKDLIPMLGFGFGFNHWFNNTIGIKMEGQYKVGLIQTPKESSKGLIHFNLALIHIVNL